MNEEVKIRKLHAADAVHGLRLSTQAGWNQTISEWNLILNDPNSICLGAVFDDQIIASAAALNYSPGFYWIAMVLTDINYRNRGISKKLLNNLLKLIDDQSLIKLDATPLGVGLYSQFGFVEENKIIRFIHHPTISLPIGKHQNIRIAAGEDYKLVIRYDMAQFGADRSVLFNWLQLQFPGYTYVVGENEEITGFVCGREGRNFTHLGPLLSIEISHALELVKYALSSNHSKPVIVDVPEYHDEFIRWLESNGFTRQREFIRMYKNKNAYSATLQVQYLIAGPEFG